MYGALPSARSGGTAMSSASTFDLAAQLTSKAEGRWWERRKEPLSAWQALVDKTGVEYYYNVETKETTWDKPVELMTSAEADNQGEWFWVPSATECFVPARITAHNNHSITAIDTHGIQTTIKGTKKSELLPVKRSSLQRVVPDLVLLDDMSAPLILHNLKQRFHKKEIYTNVGTILIAINPYCALPLYNDETVRSYARRKLGQEMPPHSFNVAHDAFVGLRDFSHNQSIVISGESGAGKTETTKHCLQYLAYMAGSASGVAAGILKTNPVLEAFGNAKTLRNDNSSRFGKFMQVFFQGRACSMSGCMIRNYLLEKIRVVRQSANERSFHVFYNLTKGADAALRAKLHLKGPEHYRYIKTCTSVPTIDDVKDWKDLVEAFTELNIDAAEQERIFSLVAAVLTLGNIDFKEDSNDYASVTDSSPESPVAIAATLLNVETAVLARGLVIKELRIKNHEATVMKLDAAKSAAQRDALAKFIYSYLFDWIVQRLNSAIGQPSDKSRFIGCLDIFGFEIFEQNSFEQLCINFTNEMLQQHFNYQTFKLEEAVYKAEGISFKHIEFIDNQPMLDLIAKRPSGLLPLLDEELIVPRGTDLTFLGKMGDHHAGNPVFRMDSKRPSRFMIKHYAGLVAYEVDGFLEKNRDTLTEDLLDVLRTSKHTLVNTLFPPSAEVSTAEKKASLGSQFRRQLDDLMTTLRLTEPHYIRCIKPNPSKAATEFVPTMCNEQLTYSGVYEAVAIRKQGFPFRLRHEEFATRYAVLFDEGTAPSGPTRDRCMAVIKFMKLDTANVQLGSTMVLYRAEEHKKLELHRNIKVRLTETHEDLERLTKIDVSGFSDEERECYFIELAGAVRAADEFRLTTGAAVRARAMLDKFVEERMDPKTKKMLEEALASKNMAKLEAVLRVCEAHGYQTSIVRQCQELLERISDAEAALRVAKQELSEEYLLKALEMCEAFDYASDTVEEARALLANMSQAKEMIRRAMASLNHEHLRKTLDFCASFNYMTPQVEACEAKLNEVLRVRESLTAARDAVDASALNKALGEADELGYDAPLVYECRLLHGRVVRIDQEANKAYNLLQERHVRAVLKAASEISYKSKAVKRLRSLADGPAAAYIQAQYTAAVKAGDHERAIGISQGLKAQRVADRGDALALRNFGALKEPLSWGHEKWWGSAQYRADTMLSFNDAYVHAPLTRTFVATYAPRLKVIQPQLLEAFENIQKVMLQRHSKRLPQRAEEILMTGLEVVEARDEIYIVLMKQINLNPDQGAIAKAFEMLALCLITFPPSPDLEDYLYYFIALPQYAQFARSFNLEYLLCRICYLNAVAQPFWGCQNALGDVPAVLRRHLPRPRAEAKSDATPWDDLRVPFHDEDYEDRARDAYKRAKAAQRAADAALAAQRRAWAADIDARNKAHNLRQQGIAASMAPPISAPINDLMPPMPEPEPVVYDEPEPDSPPPATRKGRKGKAAAAAAAVEDDDDDEASVAPRRGKKKGSKSKSAAAAVEEDEEEAAPAPKKKGKKKAAAAAAAAEPEDTAAPAKRGKKKGKKAKTIVDDDGEAF